MPHHPFLRILVPFVAIVTPAGFVGAMPMDFVELERTLPREKLAAIGGTRRMTWSTMRASCAMRANSPRSMGARLEVVCRRRGCTIGVNRAEGLAAARDGSRLAAAQAGEWLREWGWPETLLPDIAHAIEAHSFSAHRAADLGGQGGAGRPTGSTRSRRGAGALLMLAGPWPAVVCPQTIPSASSARRTTPRRAWTIFIRSC